MYRHCGIELIPSMTEMGPLADWQVSGVPVNMAAVRV
jgi:hypothetical protein